MLYMLGIKDFVVKINTIGDTQSRENYKVELRKYFENHLDELCEDCKRRFEQNPLRILDCKVDGEKELVLNAPVITDYLTEESREYFNKLLSYLDIRQIYELANIDEMGEDLQRRLREGKLILDNLKQYKFSPKTKQEMMDSYKFITERDAK